MSKVARLRIETPSDSLKRVGPQDVHVFLNDMEIKQWRNLRFGVGVDEGPVKVTLDIYPDQLEVDADAFALLQDLTPKEPDADLHR